MLKSTDTMGIETKKFIQKHEGGVVLAANEEQVVVAIRGELPQITDCLLRPLTKIFLNIAEKNPADFEVLAAAVANHFVAIAEIAGREHGMPYFAEVTAYKLEKALKDKVLTNMARELAEGYVEKLKEAEEE